MSNAIFDTLYYSKSIYKFLTPSFKNTLSFVRTYIATLTYHLPPPPMAPICVGGLLLAPLRNCNQLFTWNKTRDELPFLTVSSTPFWGKKHGTNFKPLFMAGLAYFHRFCFLP